MEELIKEMKFAGTLKVGVILNMRWININNLLGQASSPRSDCTGALLNVWHHVSPDRPTWIWDVLRMREQ